MFTSTEGIVKFSARASDGAGLGKEPAKVAELAGPGQG